MNTQSKLTRSWFDSVAHAIEFYLLQ